MRLLAKLVLIGMMAVIGILLWQRHPESKAPAPVKLVSAPAILPPQPPAPAPALTQTVPAQTPPDPFEKTMALIHLKLHQWLEAKKIGAEDEESQSMHEWQALWGGRDAG